MSSHSSSASAARFAALAEARSREIRRIQTPTDAAGQPLPVSEMFGSNTFNQKAMDEFLPPDITSRLLATSKNGTRLDMDVADSVAHGIKKWAIHKGATHFCHWFLPQTGLTAEKHDAFLWFDKSGRTFEQFTGAQLIQSEPDASSFPSGGMRSTFEARGYTAWDPASPAFIMEGPNGKTLCIPSVFIGYRGEALDQKAPLLRSMETLSRSALEVLKLFGNTTATRVVPTAGPEQEYFLIDRSLFMLRPDLLLAGRTVQGSKPPKGQELEDHYFGSIKTRVQAVMQEVEWELYRLGIPAKTRHNEVAPSQYELAPIFEEANVASDHNQLLMEILKEVARRHDMAVLLHEKPFSGINGSGKHVNWSMADSAGHNLLEPGRTPQANLQFLVFLVGVLKGVHKRAGLLRASVASSGNDHRLGANEAPPAIISVFLGEELNRILDAIEAGTKGQDSTEKRILSLGISTLPTVSRDNTDRNRTSPFAFTGNKFEFRAVGSAFAISTPMAFLNASVSEGLDEVVSAIKQGVKDGGPLDRVVMDVLKKAIIETKAIRFEGNNYSQEWVVEAERRGLPNLRTTPEALAYLGRADQVEFLSKYGILTTAEAESRHHVKLERYVKDVEIEAGALTEMINTQILPAGYRYLTELASAAAAQNDVAPCKTETPLIRLARKVSAQLSTMSEQVEALEAARSKVAASTDPQDHANAVGQAIVPALAAIRECADWLEEVIPDDLWPLPKYREMLFIS